MLTKYKIIITGEMGAGKTTAITTLSDTSMVSTDVKNNDNTNKKTSTTVGMDYGSIMINPKVRLLLFGTPGQRRFKFMWEILSKGSIGTIILIKANNPTLFDDLKFFINSFHEYGSNNILVGITHYYEKNAIAIPKIQDYIQKSCSVKNLPVIPCDPREKNSMVLVLRNLIALIEADNEI